MSRPSTLAEFLQSPVRATRSRSRTPPRFQPELLTLEDRVSPAVYTFGNPAAITINDASPASPYPSTIDVSGVVGLTVDIDVTLDGFTHTWPDDVGVLLVDPTGVNIYLMDGPGDDIDANGLVFTFDDEAPSPLPAFGALASGTYKCMNQYGDFFDPPAPPPSGSTLLSNFDGLDANGTWSLYVMDFVGQDSGSIDNGWSIIITTNEAPTISDIPDQTIDEDTTTGALAFTVGDTETPAGSLTVSGSSSNTTLVPNGNIVFGGSGPDRTVTVTPVANGFGTTTITVSVNDGFVTVSDTFLLTVNPVNDPPTISPIPDQMVNENGITGVIPFTIGDIDNPSGSLTLSKSSSNTTLVPNANIILGGSGANRTVLVIPATNQNGTAQISITVSDGTDSATSTFTLTVNAIPTISDIGDQTIDEDTSTGAIPFTVGDLETPPGSLMVTTSSSNTFLVPNANLVLGGSGASRTVTVTPVGDRSGTTTITVTVTDGAGVSAQDTFDVTVLPVNDAPIPVILGIPATPLEGAPIDLNASQIDPDSTGWNFQWSVTASNGQVIAPSPGSNFSFIPNENGTYTVTLQVTDNGSGASGPLSGTVVTPIIVLNAPPVPNAGTTYKVFAGSSVQLHGTATDPAGVRDPVTLTWDLDGDGIFGETGLAATRGTETGANPVFKALGFSTFTIYTVTLKATDDEGGSATATALVTVFPLSYKFDFDAGTLATQFGYQSVRGADLYNATRGFGWTAPATEFDNADTTALLRDGHLGVDNTFRVAVNPGTRYKVTMSFRDVFDRTLNIYAEGILRVSGLRIFRATRISDLYPRSFNSVKTVTFYVTSLDGVLDLRLKGLGLSPVFVINGLQIVKA